MTRDLVIGLDSSTTACKALIWDLQGQLVASGRAPLPMLKPRPGWHEQPADSWWMAACQALREATAQVDPNRLAGLCMAAQRETFVITDKAGQPLEQALLWMDERAHAMLPEIDRRYGKERIHQETGKPLSANLSLSKLAWMHHERPALLAAPARVLDVHAFLAHRLTGQFVTAWGCAEPMGLFDMTNGRWNESLIQTVGLQVEQLPDAVPTGAVIGEIRSDVAHECGLPAGLPLIAGIGDGQAAGLGVCAVQPGDTYLNLGTAVVTGTFSEQYQVSPAFRTMYAGIPGAYVLETVLLGGTYTISWFIENFAKFTEAELASAKSPEEILEADAVGLPPGAMGLTLVPYWNSAMTPYWDPGASGIMVGWRGIHQRGHFYRAILEGIAYELRLQTQSVEAALQQPVGRYIAVGGGARSRLWRQIIADITGKQLYCSSTPEAAALGSAILAAAGCGLFPDVRAAAQAMTQIEPDPIEPDPTHQAVYQRLYEQVYQSLFPALKRSLDRLADLTERGE